MWGQGYSHLYHITGGGADLSPYEAAMQAAALADTGKAAQSHLPAFLVISAHIIFYWKVRFKPLSVQGSGVRVEYDGPTLTPFSAVLRRDC
jgi:hypothetical protein